ncbi:MAG: threonine-phosphate decarboxylase CobD [Nitrospirota bacterium]|nr:threonine-phosphate decarboxylase CobD [Nitrospirota bacterium]
MTTHGGNIYSLSETLRIPERKVIDFSASINPLGVSKKIKAGLRKDLKYLTNYPDPDCHRLRRHLSRHLGIPDNNIICGNGSTELIYLVVRGLRPEKVLITAPAFSEYERAVITSGNSADITIRFLPLREEANFGIDTESFIESMQGCQMAFLCNPNNPTAQLLPRADITRIASAARDLKCFLVVDEAFIDFIPEESVVSEVPGNPYLIVLRSMTKFYALSGLRLGFGILPAETAERLLVLKEPWTVNSLAQRAGIIALKDRVYKKATFEYISKEKLFMEKGLKGAGIHFYPSPVNFYLLKHHRSEEIVLALRRKGILVRDCSNFRGLEKGFFRIAVKTHRDNALLIKELKRLL